LPSSLLLTLHGDTVGAGTGRLAWGLWWAAKCGVVQGRRSSRCWQVQKHGLQFVVYRTDNGNPVCQSIVEKKSIAMTTPVLTLEEMSVYTGPEDVKGNTGLVFTF